MRMSSSLVKRATFAALFMSGIAILPPTSVAIFTPEAQAQTLSSSERSELDAVAKISQHYAAFQTELAGLFDSPSFNAMFAEIFADEPNFEVMETNFERWKIESAARRKRVQAIVDNRPSLPNSGILGFETYSSLTAQLDAMPGLMNDMFDMADRVEETFTAVLAGDVERTEELSDILIERSIATIDQENIVLEQSRASLKKDGHPNYYLTGQSIISNNLSKIDILLFNDEDALTRKGREMYIRQMEAEMVSMKDNDAKGRAALDKARAEVSAARRGARGDGPKILNVLDKMYDHLEREFDLELQVMDIFQRKIDLYKSDQPFPLIEGPTIALDEEYYDLIDERIRLYGERASYLEEL